MKRALILLAAAAACICAGGWEIARATGVSYGHGVYCAVGTAATVGCDVGPHTGNARLVFVAVIVICIPLFAAAFASIQNVHLRRHMAAHEKATVEQVRDELGEVRRHVTATVDTATAELHRRFDDHAALVASAVAQRPENVVAADGPVSGGAGGNPAKSERLAEETPAAARRADAGGLVDAPPAATTSRKPRSPARPKGM